MTNENKKYKKVLGALTILGALAMGGTAFAQTTTPATTTTTTTVTPTAPNTGAGGDSSANYLALGVSALVVVAGATYLARSRKAV